MNARTGPLRWSRRPSTRTGPVSEPGHHLEVAGVAEQVDHLRADVLVAGVSQEPSVAPEGARVAADEDHQARTGGRTVTLRLVL